MFKTSTRVQIKWFNNQLVLSNVTGVKSRLLLFFYEYNVKLVMCFKRWKIGSRVTINMLVIEKGVTTIVLNQ